MVKYIPKLSTLSKGFKKSVFGIIVLGLSYYAISGIWLSLTQREFCATVNRFVLDSGSVERLSLIEDGLNEAKGYRVENVVWPPFYMSLGEERRRARILVGETYKFTSVGQRRRFPRNEPIIIKEEHVESCND